jgi:hypothetical protein
MVIDQGFCNWTVQWIRLKDVFAPELKQVGGPETARFAQNWFDEYGQGDWPFIVYSTLTPKTHEQDRSLIRYLGIIYTVDMKHSLNDEVEQFVIDNKYPAGIGK